MIRIYPITTPLLDAMNSSYFQSTREWAGYALKIIKNIPQQMHSNPKFAFAFLAVTPEGGIARQREKLAHTGEAACLQSRDGRR